METFPVERQRGFTLLETLIALAVLGVALLIGAALAGQTKRTHLRLEEELRAYRQLEAAVEQMRSGREPIEDGLLDLPLGGNGSILVVTRPDQDYPSLIEVELHYLRVHAGTQRQSMLKTHAYRP